MKLETANQTKYQPSYEIMNTKDMCHSNLTKIAKK